MGRSPTREAAYFVGWVHKEEGISLSGIPGKFPHAEARDYPIETYLLKDCRPKGTDLVRLYNRSLRFVNAEEE
jgi:hypothetical protein